MITAIKTAIRAAIRKARGTSRRSAFASFAALVLIAAFSLTAVLAAAVNCPHCSKSVDSKNTLCPYCLGEIAKKPEPKQEPPAADADGDSKASPVVDYDRARPARASRLVTEAEIQTYVTTKIVAGMVSDELKITVESAKRDKSRGDRFSISGRLFDRGGRPMQKVGRLIEKLTDAPPFSSVNLSRAAKADINEPRVVNFTITLRVDADSLGVVPKKPVEFAFTVPESPDAAPGAVYQVKVLKIAADLEEVVYNNSARAGEKVSTTLIPVGGMSVVVFIDGKKIYEKKY